VLNVPCLEARSDFVGRNRWTGFSGLIARFHRSAFGRVLATPIRLLGDFDRTEEAAHDAFKVALEQWPQQGVPDNPRIWLISVGRFKAIDKLRRDARFDTLDDIPEQREALIEFPADAPDEDLEDDQLRLIFTCSHHNGDRRVLVDGSFTESKELIAGYTLIKVSSRTEAIEWSRRFPNPAGEGNNTEIEVRPLFDLDDFEPSEAIDRFHKLEAAKDGRSNSIINIQGDS